MGLATAGLRIETLPAEVVQRAKQRVLDTMGCLIAGYHAGIADAIRSYVLAQEGARESTLLPGGQKTTVALAALAHATYIHGLELSDAAPRATVHPGKEIIPAALALAERLGVGGAAVLPAIVAGYETEIRVGRSLFPGAFYRGWWTPGMFGAIGPAVTAGHLLGPAFRAEALADKAIWAAAEKVRIAVNPNYERQYPARSLARVTLRLRNGHSYSREGDRSARGRYLTPTQQDIEEKFRLIATPVLGRSKTNRVVALVQKLETLPSVRGLVRALRAD